MGVRILIVEDNALNMRLARIVLELRGHQIDAATTVQEAAACLQAAKPALILLDIHVPGGGGPALLRQIRNDSTLHDLPVIAVTALAMDGDRERLLQEGFDGYISKPIDTRTFGPEVETYLK
jgi:CheY-like chemotaxis protein